ncbi:hypothetical protein EYF80_036719 [Liparis tanakae]|uniref:Uncharacterized protein n=1 Tax=Liparis tanakae TaxID=230148 RepID=A0A4Z2GJW0_9TELE|nr:hypothetical protein EYF80_036719 [Liparis tanakae]
MGLGGRGNRQTPGGGTSDCKGFRGGGRNGCMRSMLQRHHRRRIPLPTSSLKKPDDQARW